jgi:hypothetical protein
MARKKLVNDQGYVYPTALQAIPIPDYEGLPVTATAAKITKTGDGLSQSLRMAPLHVPSETKVMVLVYAKATHHDHHRVTEGTGKDKEVMEEFVEVVTLEAEGALLIDPDLVGSIVTEHQQRVAEALFAAEREKREAKGEFELPLAVVPDADEPGGEG